MPRPDFRRLCRLSSTVQLCSYKVDGGPIDTNTLSGGQSLVPEAAGVIFWHN